MSHLLATWQNIRDEITATRNRLTLLEAESRSLEARLTESGIELPTGASYLPSPSSSPTVSTQISPKPFDMDDEAKRMLRNLSVPETAVLVIEWLFGLRRPAPPAKLADLLSAFPPSLRSHYSNDEAHALEALRQQVVRRVRAGTTILTYDRGVIGQRQKERPM